MGKPISTSLGGIRGQANFDQSWWNSWASQFRTSLGVIRGQANSGPTLMEFVGKPIFFGPILMEFVGKPIWDRP